MSFSLGVSSSFCLVSRSFFGSSLLCRLGLCLCVRVSICTCVLVKQVNEYLLLPLPLPLPLLLLLPQPARQQPSRQQLLRLVSGTLD
jgi:hypothetical protein